MSMFSTLNGIIGGGGVFLSSVTITSVTEVTQTVPAGANWVLLKQWAPGGAATTGANGGGGAYSQVKATVTAGETLYCNAGAGGALISPFVSGGGGALNYVSRVSNPSSLTGILAIPGSGGGGGTSLSPGAGGAGGGTTGSDGVTGSGTTPGTGGGGGTSSAGGTAGVGDLGGFTNGTNGNLLIGGIGGGNNANQGETGGRGGYGKYGGGGGGGGPSGGGGGGGSSYSSTSYFTFTGGSGRLVANSSDPSYVAGKGNGGLFQPNGQIGEPGLIVIQFWAGFPQ